MRRPIKRKYTPKPDVRFDSTSVEKFINYMMLDGKKETARKLVYGAFDELKKEGHDPVAIFDTAISNVGPTVEVRSRRVGGANYQVPREVRTERRVSLAMRWIRDTVRARTGGSTAKFLAEELLLASNNEGAAYLKKENTHKMAEANRAFAHFAW